MKEYNIIDLRQKFYQTYKNFDFFKNLTEEDFKQIDYETSFLKENYKGFELYTLLLDMYNHGKYSFDEKMAGMIRTCDPELKSLELYKKHGKPTREQVMETNAYSIDVRRELGFYDPNFKRFEAHYKKNVSNKEKNKVRTLKREPNNN